MAHKQPNIYTYEHRPEIYFPVFSIMRDGGVYAL